MRLIIVQCQWIGSRRFQLGFRRVNLHRLTLVLKGRGRPDFVMKRLFTGAVDQGLADTTLPKP